MRRAFKTRTFARWQGKTELTDRALCGAVSEMERGLIDADLGAGVVKKRVPLPGQGKRGGTRTLVATNKGNRWFFMFGFSKNERADIDLDELKTLQELAKEYLSLDDYQLEHALTSGKLSEICHEHHET